MKIKEILIEKTNDRKEFDSLGKNWFIKFRMDNKKSFGIEIKPEMTMSDVAVEFIQFMNLLIIQKDE